ncbi:helix-turn-helix domain-containing protein [Kitasatospora purpeofusca]|uniref:helix-turn-helix domain-containing protein n=1 Tax=Kitasatospora purpeofusca TaxID=67352 RepID=UPI0035E07432
MLLFAKSSMVLVLDNHAGEKRMDAAKSAPVSSPARSVVVRSGARFGLASHRRRARQPAVRQKVEPEVSVSAQEAATRLGVHISMVYRWIDDDLLAHTRLGADPPKERGTGRRGGAIRVPIAAIEAMQKVRQQKADRPDADRD